nr:immunoglobulin heavy chain junction region [Macaca mulatta]MOV87809.1 immunoglobulin heavy chain junction region [Macaca mulatta]MOV89017.1 immunoglobulin heavy chain junction region [Macaca mulatta]MOV89225.1 immunoglobulin heavy chain junction region [Macaca mulatta]MOV90040.1 immunoglobulin heavy chain junction region [Macaca mulatta]
CAKVEEGGSSLEVW